MKTHIGKMEIDSPFMANRRREELRRKLAFIIGLMLLALAGGVLAIIFHL